MRGEARSARIVDRGPDYSGAGRGLEIIVGTDVRIRYGAIVLPGVTIGRGAIIRKRRHFRYSTLRYRGRESRSEGGTAIHRRREIRS